MVLLTIVAGLLVFALDGGVLFAACIGAAGCFWFGWVLWRSNEDRALDDIGRSIMLAVPLALVIGVPQYLIDQRQKRSDFILSLEMQDDLTGADLSEQDLTDIRLRGKRLARADLHGADLQDADLVDTNLRNANLNDADLRGADLRGAELQRATLVKAKLQGAKLEGARMADANLAKARLQRADLELASLKHSCMAGAELRHATMSGADLAGAVLTRADVRDVEFEDDLKPARVESAGLARVRHDGKTHWPLGFNGEIRSRAIEGDPPDQSEEPTRPTNRLVPARVREVVDGDTLRLASGIPGPGRARLIGLDAPDLRRAGGKAARRMLVKALEGRRVNVELGTTKLDKRSRYLVNLWHENGKRTFNEDLLESGTVFVRDRGRKANPELIAQFDAAELRAKQRGVGLWRTCPLSERSG